MASILKIGNTWRVQIRRKGHKAITETFPTKAAADKWARKIESDIDHQKHQDTRSLAGVTVGQLIDRYNKEIGTEKPFGKNKKSVLASLTMTLGDLTLAELTAERLQQYIRDRRSGGTGGVTISIDLTYMASVLKTARHLWKIPVSLDTVADARASMSLMGISTRSRERDRRPTADEIARLCDYFDTKSALPMRDIIQFAIATAMRLDEIMRIRWADLNDAHRTVIIRNRKHPRQKQGNDQEVPLLGQAWDIAQRQPKTDDGRIFPCRSATVSSIFPRACAALQIKDLHFHDLRHEGVSRLFEQGYAIEQVALVSGHRDWKMLARYTQIRAKDLHRPVSAAPSA